MVIITDTIVFLKIAEHHTPIAPMKNERTITSSIKINRYFHSIPPYKKLSASAGSVLIININTLASTAVSLPNAIEKEDTGAVSIISSVCLSRSPAILLAVSTGTMTQIMTT